MEVNEDTLNFLLNPLGMCVQHKKTIYSNTHYFDGRESVIDKMYNTFWGLTSQTIDELLVKLDLNDI